MKVGINVPIPVPLPTIPLMAGSGGFGDLDRYGMDGVHCYTHTERETRGRHRGRSELSHSKNGVKSDVHAVFITADKY
ncbi:MAG: hypothetical protein P8Y48_16340 [Novosphingobium sp.]